MTSKELYERCLSIQTRPDFTDFARALQQYFEEHPEKWENDTIDKYLEGLAGWTDDMDGYFMGIGEPTPEHPDWKLFGRMLLAAVAYE